MPLLAGQETVHLNEREVLLDDCQPRSARQLQGGFPRDAVQLVSRCRRPHLQWGNTALITKGFNKYMDEYYEIHAELTQALHTSSFCPLIPEISSCK